MKKNSMSIIVEKAIRFILEYLPLIITLLIASWFSVVNTKSNTEKLDIILLLLLGISVSNLTDRFFQGRKIEKKLTILSNSFNSNGIDGLISNRRKTESAPLEDRFNNFSSLIITGGSLSRLGEEYLPFFREKLSNGCTIQIYMIRPYTEASKLLGKNVVHESQNENSYNRKIKETLNRFLTLKSEFPNSIQIFLYDTVPPYSIIASDLDKKRSKIHVELYTYAVPLRERINFLITQEDKKMYSFFEKQLEQIRTISEEVNE
ncbi:hypothetical protein [Enterococcus sp. AZ126]|uniref:hypothetical protein n=1 Tax=Enterococcus sp. AZ126 TaxID=2774635 RepID=UPI003F284B57